MSWVLEDCPCPLMAATLAAWWPGRDQLSFDPGPPHISRVCELLGPLKGAILWKQSCRICRTQGGSGMSRRNVGKGAVVMALAEAGDLNQTNSSCNEPLQVKPFVQKGTVCDTLQLPVPLPE